MSTTPVQTPTEKQKVPYEKIVKFFRYPLEEASQKLGLEKNELIEQCRQQGIKRWPYRRGMKSLEVEIDQNNKPTNMQDFKGLIMKKLQETKSNFDQPKKIEKPKKMQISNLLND